MVRPTIGDVEIDLISELSEPSASSRELSISYSSSTSEAASEDEDVHGEVPTEVEVEEAALASVLSDPAADTNSLLHQQADLEHTECSLTAVTAVNSAAVSAVDVRAFETAAEKTSSEKFDAYRPVLQRSGAIDESNSGSSIDSQREQSSMQKVRKFIPYLLRPSCQFFRRISKNV